MRAWMAAAALLVAAAPAAGAQAKPGGFVPIFPKDGERYDFFAVFTGPCTPANTLPKPSRGDQIATSTWTESIFHQGDPEKPWGAIRPRPKADEEGVFPQPQNPRGKCKADYRGRSIIGADTVQPIHAELGMQTMTTYRITSSSGVCGAETSESDISPQANWCFVDEGPSGEEVVSTVTFELYWRCLYEVLQADPGAKVSHRSGKKKGVVDLKRGGVVMGGDAVMVPFGHTVVLRSGGVEMHLGGGYYETKELNDCELKSLTSGGRILKSPPPVPPKVLDGEISATIDDVKNFVIETPAAVIKGLTGSERRSGPEDRPDRLVVVHDRKRKRTRACAKHGRLSVDPRAKGRRTVTVAAGRCVTVRG